MKKTVFKHRWRILLGIALCAAAFVSCDGGGNDVFDPAEPGEEAIGNAAALFGYSVDHSLFFTQHLTHSAGVELTKGTFSKNHRWDPMTSFTLGGRQYVMGHGNESDGRYGYFIQEVYTTGDLGAETDYGTWANYYDKLAGFTVGDRTFIFGHSKDANHRWFVQEILPGGKLAPNETHWGNWRNYFGAVTPVYVMNRTCLFMQTDDDDNYWKVMCTNHNGSFGDDDDGKLWLKSNGRWANYWPVLTSYRAGGQTYLFGHRRRYDAAHVTYRGPWFIQKINDWGTVEEETARGEWQRYYATMSSYYYPPENRFYLLGHNTDKHFFIQHVTFSGTMGAESYNSNWGYYYDYFLPIRIDSSYFQYDNWMDNHNSIIGDRKLYEVALPGSHDAGMNEDDFGDCYPSGSAKKCNTITQRGNMAYQLSRGARYFDLRPVLAADSDGTDNWRTGHTAKSGPSLYGCKGESKYNICHAIHEFFRSSRHSREVIFLKISHCVRRDAGLAHDCTTEQLNALAEDLAWQLDTFLFKCDLSDCLFREMTINDILKKGNVVLLVSGENIDGSRTISFYNQPSAGIFKMGLCDDIYIYDNYSNSMDFWTMRNNQVGKLLNRNHHIFACDENNSYRHPFLLSWTLTLDAGSAIGCNDMKENGILSLAYKAQWRLFEEMKKLVEDGKITKTLFPNILYVDDFNGSATRTAMYLNSIYDTLEDDTNE